MGVGSHRKRSLIRYFGSVEQIKKAISNVSEKIQGYTQAADGFVKGVTSETVRLGLLTKKLRDCLEKLQKLKDDYNILIQKITSLEDNFFSDSSNSFKSVK